MAEAARGAPGGKYRLSPLVGATVSATGGQATRDAVTDSDGIFLLPLQQEIKPGAVVRIRVYKEGYEQYEKQEPASAEVPLTIFLSPTKGTRDVEVKLIFKATLCSHHDENGL